MNLKAGANPDVCEAQNDKHSDRLPKSLKFTSPSGRKGAKSANAKTTQAFVREVLTKDTVLTLKLTLTVTLTFVREVLPEDTVENREKYWSLLYETHVKMITHGAILCGENPNCGECPMILECDYGQHHYTPEGEGKASQTAARKRLQEDRSHTLNACEIPWELEINKATTKHPGEPLPRLFVIEQEWPNHVEVNPSPTLTPAPLPQPESCLVIWWDMC